MSVCHICLARPCLRESLDVSGLISVSPSQKIKLYIDNPTHIETVTRHAGGIQARDRVGSASEFGRTWLQRVGRCADSSFSSRISVTDRGLVARCDGRKGSKEGNYECGVGSVTQQ